MITMGKHLQEICPDFATLASATPVDGGIEKIADFRLRIVDVGCGISHLSCGLAVSTHPWKKPLRKFFEPVIKNNHLY